jgi:hypothetical protein
MEIIGGGGGLEGGGEGLERRSTTVVVVGFVVRSYSFCDILGVFSFLLERKHVFDGSMEGGRGLK